MIPSGVVHDNVPDSEAIVIKEREERGKEDKAQAINWPYLIFLGTTHLFAIYGAKLYITDAKALTIAWSCLLFILSVWGLAIGAHRMWSHRAFKAKLPLRIFLTFCNTLTCQLPIFSWVLFHRLHHKYTETDADHCNAKRGFFFSHIGWLLYEKHPEIVRVGRTIDMSDVKSDPCVIFQKKHYLKLAIPLCFVMPTVVPALWGESLVTAFFTAAVCRFVFALQVQFCLNSVAHYVGDRPYDKSIAAAQTFLLNLLTMGEGEHNFHHVFPWDYKASEYSHYPTNLNTAFIDLMAWIGMAYDLKTVKEEVVKAHTLRTGDGTHRLWNWRNKELPSVIRLQSS